MVKNSKRSTMQFRPSVKPGMEKKDLTTPRHSNDTRRRRVARRAAKYPTKSGKVQVKLQLNCISSLLAGVRKPTNAFERCLYNQFVGSSIPLVIAIRVPKENLPHFYLVSLSVLILGRRVQLWTAI